jgi:protease-4
MNDSAASGGYYVAADADWIVAQPLTITGSIGVIWIKLAVQELLNRIGIKSETLQRGAHAGLFTTEGKWDEEQRAIIWNQIDRLYDRFKEKVASGRKLKMDEVEDVSKGQVWSGRQALDRQLVDQLGDYEDALQKVRELANLDPDMYTPALWITPSPGLILPGPIPPQPFQDLNAMIDLLQEQTWLLGLFDFEIK